MFVVFRVLGLSLTREALVGLGLSWFCDYNQGTKGGRGDLGVIWRLLWYIGTI